MDNMGCHEGPRVRQMIGAVGADLLFLLPCCPDFNPTENAFAKLRAHLRKVAACILEGLWAVIGLISASSPRRDVKTPFKLRDMSRNDRFSLVYGREWIKIHLDCVLDACESGRL
ncbi:hypothetical protein V5F44_06710 [Xanthobacter sp. V2C-8]